MTYRALTSEARYFRHLASGRSGLTPLSDPSGFDPPVHLITSAYQLLDFSAARPKGETRTRPDTRLLSWMLSVLKSLRQYPESSSRRRQICAAPFSVLERGSRMSRSTFPSCGTGSTPIGVLLAIVTCCATPAWSATFTPTNVTPPGLTPQISKLTVNYMLDPVNGAGKQVFASLGAGVVYKLEHCGRYVRFTLDPYKNDLVYARNDWDIGVAGATGSGNGQFLDPRDIDAYFNGTLVIADTGNDRLVFVDWFDTVVYVEGSEVPCTLTPGSPSIAYTYRGTIGPADGFSL